MDPASTLHWEPHDLSPVNEAEEVTEGGEGVARDSAYQHNHGWVLGTMATQTQKHMRNNVERWGSGCSA